LVANRALVSQGSSAFNFETFILSAVSPTVCRLSSLEERIFHHFEVQICLIMRINFSTLDIYEIIFVVGTLNASTGGI
jgi:hypothetical protein